MRCAGVDRLGAEGDALDEVVGETCRDERSGRIEQDGVAPLAGLTGEHGADDGCVLRRRATA